MTSKSSHQQANANRLTELSEHKQHVEDTTEEEELVTFGVCAATPV